MEVHAPTAAKPGALVPALAVGTISGIMSIVDAVAFAALLWAGDVASGLTAGIAAILLGAGLMALIIAARSSYEATVAEPQDSSLAVLTIAGAGIVAAMPEASADAKLAAVAAVVALSSFAVAVAFLALGYLRLASVVRYLPYPVIGGFIAGTGWILVQGALTVATGAESGIELLHEVRHPDAAAQIVPVVAFGAGLVILLRRTSHPLAVPAFIAAAAALFYAGLWVTGTTIEGARAHQLLLGPFPEGALWRSLRFPDPAALPWAILAQQAGVIGSVVLVSVMGLLLSATGLELAVRRDLDLDHELKVAGWANLANAAVAAPPGFHALDTSVLAHHLGGERRLVGGLVGAICLVSLAFDASLLGYVPNLIPAGLLFFLGLEFLGEWVWQGYRRMPPAEWAILLLILVLIAAVGFVEGVAAGILVSTVIFVYNYARINVVRRNLTGAEFSSNVDRPRAVRAALTEHGGEVLILVLEGYLFFGTAARLLATARERLAGGVPLRYLVLDFERVRGLDSSAAAAFQRLMEIAEEHGTTVVIARLGERLKRQLAANGLTLDSPVLKVFPDLDQAMEWCEERMLETMHLHAAEFDARVLLRDVGGEEAEELLKRLKPETYPDGHVLIHRGEGSRDMFLLTAGRLRVQITLDSGRTVRLRTVTTGALIGELAYVLGQARGADVVVEGGATLYRLSPEVVDRLEAEGMHARALLDHFIARALAERLSAANRSLEAALR